MTLSTAAPETRGRGQRQKRSSELLRVVRDGPHLTPQAIDLKAQCLLRLVLRATETSSYVAE